MAKAKKQTEAPGPSEGQLIFKYAGPFKEHTDVPKVRKGTYIVYCLSSDINTLHIMNDRQRHEVYVLPSSKK